MIPQNTRIITTEMVTQLEIEQTEFLKELQNHYSWKNGLKFQFSKMLRKAAGGVIIH